jgi:hypothetical protein
VSEDPALGDDRGLVSQLAAVARWLAYEACDSSVTEAEVYGPASLTAIGLESYP